MEARGERPVLAVAAAAAAGFAILSSLMTWNVLSWDQDQPSWPRQGLLDILMPTGFCMMALLVSFVLGTPVWTRLVAERRHSLGAAAAIGFVTTFIPVYGYVSYDSGTLLSLIPLSAIGGLIGAICWCAGWAAGYRRG